MKEGSKEMSDAAVGAQGAITQPSRPRQGLYTLHTDGGIVAAPGQPTGVAAIGAVLKNSQNLLVEAISRRIGHVNDHHVAEFRALIEGLRMAKRHGVDKIRVFTDSQLVVGSVHNEVKLGPRSTRSCARKPRRFTESSAIVG